MWTAVTHCYKNIIFLQFNSGLVNLFFINNQFTFRIVIDFIISDKNNLSHAAADIASKLDKCPQNFDEYKFDVKSDAEPIPHGLRTEIRHIMQQSYFVIPDRKAAVEGFERVKEIKNILTHGNFIVNADFVEAKSLATVAYLILKEVI